MNHGASKAAFLLAGIVALSVFVTQIGHACSTFVLRTDGRIVVGRNLDWDADVPGLLVVNKRGIQKKGLPWRKFVGPSKEPMNTPSWVSKYGSVTFTAFGREFPDNGMNEAGLVVEEMTLESSEYPMSKEKPTLSVWQWMQYQLDNFATVEEVIANIGAINPRGNGLHFIVADANGDCATIEFLNGSPVIHTGDRLPVSILTNAPYAENFGALGEYKGFGGEKPIPDSCPNSWDSLDRFVEGCHLLKNYDRQRWPDPVHVSFAILQAIGGLDHATRRQIVHDIPNRRIWFETSVTRSRRYIDLDAFDFSPETPVMILDVDAKLWGDVSDDFREYSHAAHREKIRQIFRGIFRNEELKQVLSNELEAEGATLDDWIDTLAAFPDTTRVAGGQSTVEK